MSENNGRVHLLGWRMRNFGCISELQIDELGDVHWIKGDTGQGKSKVLESLYAGIYGIDPEMIMTGKDEAEIVLDLSNATLQRVAYRDGRRQKLTLKDRNGQQVKRAQEFLSAVYGPKPFRVVDFVRLGARRGAGDTERRRQQRDQVLEAVPMRLSEEDFVNAIREELGDEFLGVLGEVDLDEVSFEQHALLIAEQSRSRVEEARTRANSELEIARAKLMNTPAPEAKAPEASLPELQAASKRAMDAFYRGQSMATAQGALSERRAKLKARIDEDAATLPNRAKLKTTKAVYTEQAKALHEKIEELEDALQKAKNDLFEVNGKVDNCAKLETEWENHEARLADLASINTELAGDGGAGDVVALKEALDAADLAVRLRQAQDAHNAAAAVVMERTESAKRLQRFVDFLRDDLPKRLIQRAKMPIEGMGVDGDSLTVNGVPMYALGTSESIKIGVDLFAALYPEAGLLPIDGVESMGRADRLAMVASAKAHDLQIVATEVAPDALPGPDTTVMRGGAAVS